MRPDPCVIAVGPGFNSQLAIVVETAAGTRIFVKGLRSDEPRARTQQTEAAINPAIPVPGEGGECRPR